MPVVGIDEMHRRDVAFAAPRRRDAAQAADRDGARGEAALGQRADHDVERDVVAAHDDEIGRARGAAPISVTRACVPASSAAASASISMKPSACEKLVTEPEPFGGRERDRAVARPATSDTSTNSLRPSSEAMRTGTRASTVCAASGGRPARARITGATKAWKVKIAEVGKPGSTAIGLSVGDREAERLAGLQRHAVHQDAGLAELRHDAMREVARALRRAAGQHHHVAFGERAAHRLLERRLVVGKRAERHRLAAGFGDGGRDDRAVAVIDAAGPQRARRARTSSSPVESTATFGRRTTSTSASPQAASMPISREPIALALAQQRLAARDVGAGIGDELARRRRRGGSRSPARVSISSVCSIITTASAPRGTTPPVAMVVAVPGATSTFGAWPQAITSALSASCFGAPSLAPDGVGGAQREAVDIGAVERRHVERRDHVMRQHAAERCRERHALGRAAARDRAGSRSACAPPRRRPLRGTAPAAPPARTAASSSLSACAAPACALMASGLTDDARARRMAFAVGRNQDPAVGARQRLQRQIAADASGSTRPSRAAHRNDLGKAERRGDLARQLGGERLLLDQPEREPRQHAAADGEPAGQRRVDAARAAAAPAARRR